MPLSSAVEGFRLAYDRGGTGAAVVLLHGWPGARTDQAAVAGLLREHADVVTPDLRGFGDTEGPSPHATRLEAFNADGQTRSILGLIDDLGLERPVIAGYDVGSRVAQAVARARPEAIEALVVAPPLPGAGDRVLSPEAQEEFWYQAFHRLALAERLVDGNETAVRAYLGHFWSHWSAPDWTPPGAMLDELTVLYSRPGAFSASIAWYRAGAGTVATSLHETRPPPTKRITVPTTVLWPEHDPLFPASWSDRLGEFFVDVELRSLDGVGHFSPLEAPEEFAHAVLERM